MESSDGETLTLTAAVDLLASHVRKPNESRRQAKDKIRKRMLYAVERGYLTKSAAGRFARNEVVGWARPIWPGKLSDIAIPLSVEIIATALRATASMSATVIPIDLVQCQERLRDAQEKIFRLTDELARAKSEIDQLRPMADQWGKLCAKNKVNAKHRGKEQL